MGARIEPGEAARESPDLELPVLEELLVDGGDFELAARGGLDASRDVDDLVGVEIKTYDGIIGLGLPGLLLDGKAVAGRVELGDAVTLGVVDPITEDRSLILLFDGVDRFAENPREPGAVEDVVAEDQADRIAADELPADDECLGQAAGHLVMCRSLAQEPVSVSISKDSSSISMQALNTLSIYKGSLLSFMSLTLRMTASESSKIL